MICPGYARLFVYQREFPRTPGYVATPFHLVFRDGDLDVEFSQKRHECHDFRTPESVVKTCLFANSPKNGVNVTIL